jgi:hypothetical protein
MPNPSAFVGVEVLGIRLVSFNREEVIAEFCSLCFVDRIYLKLSDFHRVVSVDVDKHLAVRIKLLALAFARCNFVHGRRGRFHNLRLCERHAHVIRRSVLVVELVHGERQDKRTDYDACDEVLVGGAIRPGRSPSSWLSMYRYREVREEDNARGDVLRSLSSCAN